MFTYTVTSYKAHNRSNTSRTNSARKVEWTTSMNKYHWTKVLPECIICFGQYQVSSVTLEWSVHTRMNKLLIIKIALWHLRTMSSCALASMLWCHHSSCSHQCYCHDIMCSCYDVIMCSCYDVMCYCYDVIMCTCWCIVQNFWGTNWHCTDTLHMHTHSHSITLLV